MDEYWWQAKVYDIGSRFGINKGRVSKLAICKGDSWIPTEVVFNYDRGLDFNEAPQGLVERVIAHCESLSVAKTGTS